MTHMWTGGGGGPPAAYVDLILCRDIFHCTPTELDEQPADVVMMMLEMHSTEQHMKATKRQMMKAGRGGKKRRRR